MSLWETLMTAHELQDFRHPV